MISFTRDDFQQLKKHIYFPTLAEIVQWFSHRYMQ